MGSIPMLVYSVLVVAMAGLASRVHAGYHVSKVSLDVEFLREFFAACPSNHYSYACFKGAERRGAVSQQPPSLTAFITLTNLYGYPKLNHYLNSDGTYSVYVNKGDGTLVATCHGADQDRVTLTCPVFHATADRVYDHLICYGQPCQPDVHHQHGPAVSTASLLIN